MPGSDRNTAQYTKSGLNNGTGYTFQVRALASDNSVRFTSQTASATPLSQGAWTDVCVTASNSNCPAKTSHTLTGLEIGKFYVYQLRAVSAGGNGDRPR